LSNEQLYMAVGLPIVINILFNGMLFLVLSQRMADKFAAIDKRFDDMRDLWRAELRRVEEVLDARLKHLEEKA
jgi:hypothetical protein